MAGNGSTSRVRVLLFGPLSRPRYRGDLWYELMRETRRSLRAGLAALLVVGIAGLALLATSTTEPGRSIGLLLAFPGAPVAMAAVRVLIVRRRARPAGEVLLWWAAVSADDWAQIDGGTVPTSTEEAFRRLEGQSGNLAERLRIGYDITADRLDEAEAALAAWEPADPLDRARRERYASAIAFRRGTDDLAAADAAVEAIPDDAARRDQRVMLAIERGSRASIDHRDAIAVLVDARRLLGPVDLRAAHARFRPSRAARVRQTVTTFAAGLAVVAVIGLAFGTHGPVAVDNGDANGVAWDTVTLRQAGRALPPTGDALSSLYARADVIIENALPAAIDLDATGSLGANRYACTMCVDWQPYGRSTKMPPNARGPRVWRVTVLLADALAGRGPGIAEIWFSSADPNVIASMRAATEGDATPSYRYQLSQDATNALLDLFFPRVTS